MLSEDIEDAAALPEHPGASFFAPCRPEQDKGKAIRGNKKTRGSGNGAGRMDPEDLEGNILNLSFIFQERNTYYRQKKNNCKKEERRREEASLMVIF